MRELISIHVGQAGVQIGNSCWELYCLEHGVQPDGTIAPGRGVGSPSSIFRETAEGTHIPRSIYVDLDPTTIDEVRAGKYHELFHPDSLINSTEDSSNCFVRACSLSKKGLLNLTVDQIRKQTEQCDNLQGFVVFHSLCGGTGSGLWSLLVNELDLGYKKPNISLTLYPSLRYSTTTVEPYNALLASNFMDLFSKCNIMFDNESLYELCSKAYDIERPSYNHINNLISQVASSLTASSRFGGDLRMNLGSFLTNLCPYERVHYPMCSYSPMLSAEKACIDSLSVARMTYSVLDPLNLMMKCFEYSKYRIDNRQLGRFLSCVVLYRGDVIPKDVNSVITVIQKKRRDFFSKKLVETPWSKCRFKIGINHQPPAVVPGSHFGKFQRALCMFTNSTSVTEPFQQILNKSYNMLKKNAFVHWYQNEGMEFKIFIQALESLEMIINEINSLDQTDEKKG